MRRSRNEPRRGSPADLLVVGLGNPGAEFEGTRHNVGAEVANELARRQGAALRNERRLRAQTAELRMSGRRVLVAVPTTYMNDSGSAVVALVRRAGLEGGARGGGGGGGDDGERDLSRLVVVHDELDLPAGRVKLKVGGGAAGHNGLRSIDQHLHAKDYVRIRIGIGKPPGRQPGPDYVLSRPSRVDRERLGAAVTVAADAVESLVSEGVEAAMNRFNAGP